MTTQAPRDTIFALSSGRPPAGIAVVRVSGPAAAAAMTALAGTLPSPRRAAVRTLRDGGELLDRALLLWLPGPATATGEDIAEFHLHGGRAVIAGVEAALARMPSLRTALPGEFTRRALDHGRIDLTEAEGLADLLTAETATQRRAALALSGGALSREIALWRERLLGITARLEASLDFADEDDAAPASNLIETEIEGLAAALRTRLAQPSAERLRDGVRVVLAGPPNAGKSTLLNVLAERDAAITSEMPGTTRDLIEVPVAIDGVPFVLIDTAGLRVAQDAIEGAGVARAHAAIAAADMILWLGDDSPIGAAASTIALHARADRLDRQPPPPARLAVSARNGSGIAQLRSLLTEQARALLPVDGDVAINARHRALLSRAADALERSCKEADPLIVAEELRDARRAFDMISGAAGVEDMLDRLFAELCIGK